MAPRTRFPPGAWAANAPSVLDAIQVFDVVAPALLPEQLVAEAQRTAGVPVALYVLDIDGTHLLHMAGLDRLGAKLSAPLAVGPELDADGVKDLRRHLARYPGVELFPLWLRGRATGVLIAFGRPVRSLSELARQAAAAITLSDRYTDVFARAQRRKQPKAGAEIQQSLLPARIARVTGAEVAGNVLPSYEVAGDWFDVVENADGVWITLADGLGPTTRAAASSAVALGALRASRRSGAGIGEALVVMHQTLRRCRAPGGDDGDRRALGSGQPRIEDRQLRARGSDPAALRERRTSRWSSPGATGSAVVRAPTRPNGRRDSSRVIDC